MYYRKFTGSYFHKLKKLQDPLVKFKEMQDRLNRMCISVHDVPFDKTSRICRNIVIRRMVKIVQQQNIKGILWGLLAARPAYYFYPLKNHLTGMVNFDHCKKEHFVYLREQMQKLQEKEPTYYLDAANMNLFEAAIAITDDGMKPSIVELDGMGQLKCLHKQVVDLAVNGIKRSQKGLLVLTSSIGMKHTTYAQYFEEIRLIKEEIRQQRKIIEPSEHIEYGEPRTLLTNHCHPMCVEFLVLDKVA